MRAAAVSGGPVIGTRVYVVATVALAGGAGAAVVASRWPLPVAAVALVAAVVAVVAARPQWAAYGYLGLVPLVVGVARGSVAPFVRPHELLLAVLWLGVLAGPIRRWVLAGTPRPATSPVDGAVLALAVTTSVTPLLWVYGRGDAITVDDVLFALTMWKFLAVYLLFRITVRSDDHVRRALGVAMAATAVVAAIGVLQALELLGVPGLLGAYAPADDQDSLNINRASSTIGTPIGFADAMALAVAVAVGWLVHVRTHRVLVTGAAALFALAGLASGQLSGLVGLVVAVLAVGWAVRRLGLLLLAGAPLAAVAAIALQPVLAGRVERLDPSTGLPVSWTGEYGRLANLQTHIWPRIGEGLNWLFGVRPSSRIDAPEPWREYVWIESGYTWLLWNGGLPLLLAFVAYLVLATATARAVLGNEGAAARATAVATLAGLAVLAVLMVLDPHLTLRGFADLLFPLLAITATTRASSTRRNGADS